MNISIKEQNDSLVRFSIDMKSEDYQDAIKKELKRVAKTVSMPGFRKGSVPVDMVKKLYGSSVRIDVLNNEVAKAIDSFIKEHNFNVIGAPVADSSNSEEVEKADFTLHFSMALYPKVEDFDLGDKVFDKYEITVSDSEVKQELERAQEAAATLEDVDEAGEEAVIGGDLAELDGDSIKAEGIKVDNVTIYPRFMKSDEEKSKFVGAGKGQVVHFDPYAAFEGNETELTSLLKVEKEQVESLKGKQFSFQIETIREMKKAPLGKKFYSQIFGEEEEVSNKEEALGRIRTFMEKQQEANADYKFALDFIKYIKEEKAPHLQLADDVIYEWYTESIERNQKEGEEKRETPNKDDVMKSLKEEMYVRALSEKEAVTVSNDEVKGYACDVVRSQFAQMGWHNPDPTFVVQYAEKQLSDANFAYSMEMALLEQKLAKHMQEKVTLEKKAVTVEEFTELLNPKKDVTDTLEE